MTKYFNAVADNKRIDAGLRSYELRMDDIKRKAINRIWKTKFDLLDELVLINVKTPHCRDSKTDPEENRIDLTRMCVDDKLFSSKPISFGHKRPKTPIAPVIEVKGTEAVCYPNPEAKRGRHVVLDRRTLRRFEAAKAHTAALLNIDQCKIQREASKSDRHPSSLHRPFTAPRTRKPDLSCGNSKRLTRRPRTAVGFSFSAMNLR